jgi:2-methylisocitrate lyase-like PEP mutase family enzyme
MFIKSGYTFLFLIISAGLVSSGTACEGTEVDAIFSPQLYEKARLLHSLHSKEAPLLLPNAWDALSAKIFEQAGARAIATTSAGMAAVFGYGDGKLPRDLLFLMVDRIVKSVSIPVTVDLEAGFGDTPDDVCETVLGILKRGAVGINLEDADPKRPGHLFSVTEQTEKIKAIKSLAHKVNIPLFVNVRTDIFWLNLGPQEEKLPETLRRLQAYQEAGADGVFVPGLTNPDLISEVSRTIQLPLNLLAGPWIKDLAGLKLLGVSRLTIGSSATRDYAGNLKTFAHQYLEGNYTLNPAISYPEFNALFDNK